MMGFGFVVMILRFVLTKLLNVLLRLSRIAGGEIVLDRFPFGLNVFAILLVGLAIFVKLSSYPYGHRADCV